MKHTSTDKEIEKLQAQLKKLKKDKIRGTIGGTVCMESQLKGITQRKLAQAAGMSPQNLWSFISGRVPNPKFHTLLRLAAGLGTPLSQLILKWEEAQK